MLNVLASPAILNWALERSRRKDELLKKFPSFEKWVAGKKQPSLKQLEDFARAAYVPFGYLLLANPPQEELPVKDMRTLASHGIKEPSPNLLDVIYACQQRQNWYRDYLQNVGDGTVAFVGSVTIHNNTTKVAEDISNKIKFTVSDRRDAPTWGDALRLFIEKVEDAGILVMVSGIVGSNTHRKLDPAEFRGFSIADTLAPLVFINGSDGKAAQIFTLAHEIAHIWLGESVVSDAGVAQTPHQEIEKWCNQVAAEVLVPLAALRELVGDSKAPIDLMPKLLRNFKVSSLVILRRLWDAKYITRKEFEDAYDREIQAAKTKAAKRSGGGDFYLTQPIRIGKRFASAVITSTLEGNTLYRDAFSMLGIKKEKTFQELGATLQVVY